MRERDTYIINIDLLPTMESFRKFIVKQKRENRGIALFTLVVSVYIFTNENRLRKQQKELSKLKDEIDNLKPKGVKMMK